MLMIRMTAVLLAWALAAAGQPVRPAAASPEALMREGKYAAAVAPLEAMVRQDPKDSEALLALGICYSQTGKFPEAVSTLRRHVALEPRSADGRAVLGVVLLALGRVPEARTELEQSIRLDSSQTEAVKGLARACSLLGKPAEAVALLRSTPAADDEAKLLLAQALLKTGDAAGASAELDPLLAGDPQRPPEVYIAAATAYKNLAQLDRAFEICERGLRAHPCSERLESFYAALPVDAFAKRTERRVQLLGTRPDDVGELVALGRAMINVERANSTGAADYAEKLLARAVALAPRDPVARHFHARSLFVLEKPEEAIAGFRDALAARPDPPLTVLIRTWCGLAEARLARTERAEREFREAMRVNRTLPRHLVAPAFHYFRFLKNAMRAKEASAINDEILRWEPYFAPSLLERAKQLSARNEHRRAAEYAELALHNVESDPALLRGIHFFLARTYHTMNHPAEARVHAEWIKLH